MFTAAVLVTPAGRYCWLCSAHGGGCRRCPERHRCLMPCTRIVPVGVHPCIDDAAVSLCRYGRSGHLAESMLGAGSCLGYWRPGLRVEVHPGSWSLPFPGGGGATLVCRERFVIGPCLGCFLLLRTRRLRVDCQPPGPWRLRPKRWRAVQSDSVVTAGLALVASQLLVASTSCSLGCIAPALLGVLLQTGSLLRWVCSHYLRRPALHGGWQCSCDCNWPPLKSFRWRVAVLHFPCTILGHLTSG